MSMTPMLRKLLTLTLGLITLGLPAHAALTTVTVRAISRDAKVIGDGVGGARITIREVNSGNVLASGIQRGGTGETKRIMQESRNRGAVVYGTEGAAAFRATLDLNNPTLVEVIAEGPLKYPQAMQRASKTMLLLPGQNIEGEGVLLEIPGFIVDVLSSLTAAAGERLQIRANVTMTCGCPTEPGGLWNADNILITGRITRDGKVAGEATLRYAGETSTYEGWIEPLPPGTYNVEVLAADPSAANFGRVVQPLTIEAPAQ